MSTKNAVQLINPTGSTSGQALVSTGPNTPPGWADVVGNGSVTDAKVSTSSKLFNRINNTVDPTDPAFGASTVLTDNGPAFQLAVNFLASIGGGSLLVPAGVFKIATTVLLHPNISVVGTSETGSVISPTTAAMTVFSFISASYAVANIAIKNLSFGTVATSTPAGVTAIAFTNAYWTTVANVKFWGMGLNVLIDRGQSHTITNCFSGGSFTQKCGSLKLWSTTDTDYVYDLTVTDYKISADGSFASGGPGVFNNQGIYIRRGVGVFVQGVACNHLSPLNGPEILLILENDCQGCHVDNIIANSCNTGILLQPGTGIAVSPSYCTLSNIDIDVAYSACIAAFGTVSAPVTYLNLSGAVLTASNTIGSNQPLVQLSYSNFVNVLGLQGINYGGGNLTVGVSAQNCNSVHISDGFFVNLFNGIGLGAGNTNVNIHDNSFQNCSATVNGTYASAGHIGEYLSNQTTVVSLTNGIAANITTLSLTPGDWDVEGIVQFNPAGTTVLFGQAASVSTASATVGAFGSLVSINLSAGTTGVGSALTLPKTRVNVSVATTVYAVATGSFTTSTCTASAFLRARRAIPLQ